MDRRQFLIGTGAGLAALGLTPGDARAEAALHQQAARLLDRQRRVARRTLRRLRASDADERAQTYAMGMGALASINRLSTIPAHAQVHPTMQSTIRALLSDAGRMLSILPALLDEAAEREAPTGALKLTLAAIRDGIWGDPELSEASRRLHRNGADLIEAELDEEGPGPRLRREARRLRKLARLSGQIAAAGGDTGVLTPASPQLLAEVEASAAAWDASDPPKEPLTGTQILGLIGCGLGILVGGFLLIGGISCAVSCGGGEALLMAMLGAAIIFGGIIGIQSILRDRDWPDRAPLPELPE